MHNPGTLVLAFRSTDYTKQRCKMDEHYVESIYEKTKHIKHGLQMIDEDFESEDKEDIR